MLQIQHVRLNMQLSCWIGRVFYVRPMSTGNARPQTDSLVKWDTPDNINQNKMIELLDDIHKKHQQGKIILILDNAPYNHALRVRAELNLAVLLLSINQHTHQT